MKPDSSPESPEQPSADPDATPGLSDEQLAQVSGGYSREDHERGKRLMEEDLRNHPDSLVLFGECRSTGR